MIKTYQNRLAELKSRHSKRSFVADPQYLNAFTFFSANLSHFMPTIPYENYQDIFKGAMLNRSWSGLDQQFFQVENPFTVHGWDADFAEQLKEKPGIICTFHTGSYRLINYLLHLSGVPLALLIGQYAHDNQREVFADLVGKAGQNTAAPAFSILNATDPKVLFKIKQRLQEGTSVLTYIDGYQGTHSLDSRNSLKVHFLAQHQLVKKGLPYIAYKFNVPIYPVICFREADDSLRLIRLEPIEKKEMDIALFAEYAVNKIYSAFAAFLQHYPAQWENWTTLHLSTNRHDLFAAKMRGASAYPTKPNQIQHGLLAIRQDYFLLDKFSYRASPISKHAFRNLYKEWYP